MKAHSGWSKLIAGLILFSSVGTALWLLSTTAAKALVCESPIHTPCCESPCPVIDYDHAEDETDIQKNTTKEGELVGASRSDLDVRQEHMTPITSADLKESGLIIMLQAVRNVVRGPDLVNRIVSFSLIPDMAIAEVELSPYQLPTVNALVRSHSEKAVEALNAARVRVDSEYTVDTGLDDAARMASITKRRADLIKILTNAYARALLKKERIAKMASEMAGFEIRLNDAETLAEDFRINSELKIKVAGAQEEFAELMAIYMHARGVRRLLEDSAREIDEAAKDNTTYKTPMATRVQLESARKSAVDLASYRIAVRDAAEAHNALTSINWLRSHLPELTKIVEEHDARKNHMFATEVDLRKELGVLYVDPDAAWRTLRGDIDGDATRYGDPGRYKASARLGALIVAELIAQKRSTRYGQRLPYKNCGDIGNAEIAALNGSLEIDGGCLRYTVPHGGYVGPAMIDSYYSNPEQAGDEYKIITGAVRGVSVDNGDGNSSSEFAEAAESIFDLLQYGFEARRRKLYWDDMRRGDEASGGAMSADLWNEFVIYAPYCMYGPIAPTPENIEDRPDLFDVNAECDHRVWASGANKGWEINHMELGGVDQSIWLVENRTEAYYRTYTGRQGVEERITAANALVVPEDTIKLAEAGGRPSIAEEAAKLSLALKLMAEDTGNSSYIPNTLFTQSAAP